MLQYLYELMVYVSGPVSVDDKSKVLCFKICRSTDGKANKTMPQDLNQLIVNLSSLSIKSWII